MKSILSYFAFLMFVFLLSCSPRKQEIEYVEFEHQCFILRKSDRIFLRIFPEVYGGNERISVQLNYHGKEYATKFISRKDYDEIVKSIVDIQDNEDMLNEDHNGFGVKPIVITTTDGGLNTIEYRKGNYYKKEISQVINNNESSFRNATLLITKAAGLDIRSIK